jgi:inner membrane protein
MPTIMSHVAVPIAIGVGLGQQVIPRRLLAAGVLASILPDLDVVGFHFHIAYADAFGHRGAIHSLLAAFLIGLLAIPFSRWMQARRSIVFAYVALSAASHGLLDTLTNGGLGVALLWPWDTERFFAPWRPIEVSPFGTHLFSSPRGLAVIYSELLWVWLPALCVCAGLIVARRFKFNRTAPSSEKS